MEQDLAAEVAALRAEVDTLTRAVRPLLAAEIAALRAEVDTLARVVRQREEVRPAHATGDAGAGRRLALGLRVPLALGGLVVVVGWLIAYSIGPLRPTPAPERVPVVFPTQEIPEGALIQPQHLQTAALERWLVPPGQIVVPQQAIGRRATTSLRRGQVVLQADVSPPSAGRDP